MICSFHPHAEKELEEIENYYDSIREELGNRFRSEIETTLSRILKLPNAWQPLSKTIRRRRLSTFPYGIVYRSEDRRNSDISSHAPSSRTKLLDGQNMNRQL